jgi:hypothetical protein
MLTILRISQALLLGLCLMPAAYSQSTNPQIWRCGNLLTNQPIVDSSQGEKNKCELVNSAPTPVTLMGTVQKAKTPTASAQVLPGTFGAPGAPGAPNVDLGVTRDGPTPRDQQSSKEQMSKSILLSEKDHLTFRQLDLEGRLRVKSLSPQERQELEAELARNAADLNGLKREIAKFP